MAIELRYPDLDPAKDARLRSYLYQLVDQLQYAFNKAESSIEALAKEQESIKKSQSMDAENVPEEVLSAIKKANAFAKIVKELDDTVISDGTYDTGKGIWNYKKWKSGTYQAFGTFTVTPEYFELNNFMYKTNQILVPLPFEVHTAYVNCCASNFCYCCNAGLHTTNKDIGFLLMSDNGVEIQRQNTISITIMGNYKK